MGPTAACPPSSPHRHRCHAAACHGLATGPHLLASLFFVSPLVKWFSAESSRTFRKVRNASAQVIIQLSETMTGISVRAMRLFVIFMPGITLIGNITVGLMLLTGGYFALRR
ncbi:hypothetical protein NNA62_09695 [Cutibacterium acnes]|nr:hypothetical protein [Cutibacterium acnes]MCP9410479.1 hypothetical protein [Cutibacterium acnes]